jgi:hypothetical protein
MQPGGSPSAMSSGVAGVFPGASGMAQAGLWGTGGASLPGISQANPQVFLIKHHPFVLKKSRLPSTACILLF